MRKVPDLAAACSVLRHSPVHRPSMLIGDAWMEQDDLPPKPANDSSEDDTSFSGALGMTFAGAAWVAVFAAVGVAVLWALVHWLR